MEQIELRKRKEWLSITQNSFEEDKRVEKSEKKLNAKMMEDRVSLGHSAIKKNELGDKKSPNKSKTNIQFKNLHQQYFPEATEYK